MDGPTLSKLSVIQNQAALLHPRLVALKGKEELLEDWMLILRLLSKIACDHIYMNHDERYRQCAILSRRLGKLEGIVRMKEEGKLI